MMRKFMIVFWTLITSTCFAQQIDLTLVDKIGAKAEEKTEINMDESMLKSAAGFLDNGNKAEALARESTKNVKGIYVRSYEFGGEGAYKRDDLKPLFDKLKAPEWKQFLKSDEKDELTQIWMHTTNGMNDGLLLVSAESDELTVINLVGATNLADLAALGNLGNLEELENLGNLGNAGTAGGK